MPNELPPITCDEARSIDRRAIAEYGMTGLVLMENAGRGCVDELLSRGVKGPIVIACGRGNNGGDGLVMARHLDNRGLDVIVYCCGGTRGISGDAAANLKIVECSGIDLRGIESPADLEAFTAVLARADWVVDAMLGTGARGELRWPIGAVVERINASAARRMALDLPTGLDGDVGVTSAVAVRAEVTCTFVAPKVGLLSPAARPLTGDLVVIDIGVPRQLLTGP